MNTFIKELSRVDTVTVYPNRTGKSFICSLSGYKAEQLDTTTRITIEVACCETNRKDEIVTYVPILNSSHFKYHNSTYISSAVLCEPIISRDSNCIWLNTINPLAVPMRCIGFENDSELRCVLNTKSNQHDYTTKRVSLKNCRLVEQFRFREQDRITFNKLMGTQSHSSTLTKEDMGQITSALAHHHLCYSLIDHALIGNPARVAYIQDLLVEIYQSMLHKTLANFPLNGQVQEHYIQREIDRTITALRWMKTNVNATKIFDYALSQNIAINGKFATNLVYTTKPNGICPVDTSQMPEKKNLVLALSHKAITTDGKAGLSEYVLSGLLRKGLPFPDYMCENRVLIASSLLKQSMDLGKEGCYNQKPYIMHENTEDIPDIPGLLLTAAITDMTYTHEDSCILNEAAAERMTTFLKKRQIISTIGDYAQLFIGMHSVVAPESIIAKHNSKNFKAEIPFSGSVCNIKQYRDQRKTMTIFNIIVDIELEYKCSIGSKIAGLHGNKHIISAIWPEHKMPYCNGRPVDIVISPTTITSRLIPSMIMELMINTLCERMHNLYIIHDHVKITFDMIAEKLESVGLPDDCMYPLRNGRFGKVGWDTTRDKPNLCLVGPLFIIRLNHHSVDKLRVSHKIPTDNHGCQLRGKGAQRLGRDELEILRSVNANGIIKEIRENMVESGGLKLLDEYFRALGIGETNE